MNKNFIVRNTHITQLPFNLIGCPIAGYSIDRGHHLEITIIGLHLFRLIFLTVCLMTFLGIAPLSRVLSSLATTCHLSLASSSCCLRIISILNNQYNGWLRKRVWKHLTGKSMFTEKILTYFEFPLSNEIVILKISTKAEFFENLDNTQCAYKGALESIQKFLSETRHKIRFEYADCEKPYVGFKFELILVGSDMCDQHPLKEPNNSYR